MCCVPQQFGSADNPYVLWLWRLSSRLSVKRPRHTYQLPRLLSPFLWAPRRCHPSLLAQIDQGKVFPPLLLFLLLLLLLLLVVILLLFFDFADLIGYTHILAKIFGDESYCIRGCAYPNFIRTRSDRSAFNANILFSGFELQDIISCPFSRTVGSRFYNVIVTLVFR